MVVNVKRGGRGEIYRYTYQSTCKAVAVLPRRRTAVKPREEEVVMMAVKCIFALMDRGFFYVCLEG